MKAQDTMTLYGQVWTRASGNAKGEQPKGECRGGWWVAGGCRGAPQESPS